MGFVSLVIVKCQMNECIITIWWPAALLKSSQFLYRPLTFNKTQIQCTA